MTTRLVLEDPCEHGETEKHQVWSHEGTAPGPSPILSRISGSCPGGTRTILDPATPFRMSNDMVFLIQHVLDALEEE